MCLKKCKLQLCEIYKFVTNFYFTQHKLYF